MKKKILISSRKEGSGTIRTIPSTRLNTLNKKERADFLRKEASNFSKKFGKVLVQLANE